MGGLYREGWGRCPKVWGLGSQALPLRCWLWKGPRIANRHVITGGGAQLTGPSEPGNISHRVGDWGRDCKHLPSPKDIRYWSRIGLKSV